MDAPAIDYQQAVARARSADPAVRLALAAQPSTPPELLYFLAEDADAEVRCAVAANAATPRQADLLLAKDPDAAVRCVLARKMVGEGLAADQRAQLRRMAFTILEALARDVVVSVRHALSEALYGREDAPPHVVHALARDAAPEVARPLLEASPALEEDHLVAMLEAGAPEWTQVAIARRRGIGPRLAAAVAESGSTEAVGALLANETAAIDEPTFARIVEDARHQPAWHEALARHAGLPGRLAVALAEFVAAPLLAVLRERHGDDARVAAELERVEARRAGPDLAAASGQHGVGTAVPPSEPAEEEPETPEERAERLFATGRLTDAALLQAIEAGERDFATASLALRAGLARPAVARILRSHDPGAVTALCWKTALAPALALAVQIALADIAAEAAVLPENGAYPLSADDMDFKLALYAG